MDNEAKTAVKQPILCDETIAEGELRNYEFHQCLIPWGEIGDEELKNSNCYGNDQNIFQLCLDGTIRNAGTNLCFTVTRNKIMFEKCGAITGDVVENQIWVKVDITTFKDVGGITQKLFHLKNKELCLVNSGSYSVEQCETSDVKNQMFYFRDRGEVLKQGNIVITEGRINYCLEASQIKSRIRKFILSGLVFLDNF